MKRGDLYRVRNPPNDPKPARVFVVVSRDRLIRAPFETLICAPVRTRNRGLETEVPVGIDEGLLHDSAILCDGLVSMPRQFLTNYVGSLGPEKLAELRRALRIALDVE